MSRTPRFSIVIPTRNRAATLAATLRTCVDLDHPDFEIVVTDNDSTDDTSAIVGAFDDPRIHYTKTPTYVSMAHNFENGLRHARGEFLIFIGDDDGILPFGLRVLDLIFAKHPGIDVIDWALNPFLWPHAQTAKVTLNWLSNLRGPEIETADQAWRRVNCPLSHDYNQLTGFNIYHGCVRRRVLDAASAAGVSLLGSPVPDVAAAIRILRFARRKLRLDVAITINGTSRMSSGWAHVIARPSQSQLQIRSEFKSMTARDFPDAALVQYNWTRMNAFVGPMIDEHLETRGSLNEMDTEAWRRIYVDHLVRIPPSQVETQRLDINEILVWMQERGARSVGPITADDVKAYRVGQERLPQFFLQPFRFSEATLAAAVNGRQEAPSPRADDSRILSIAQRKDDILLEVQATGEEFTIYDYVQLTASFMSFERSDPARLLVEDPAVFRARLVLGVLGRVAAFAGNVRAASMPVDSM